MSEVLIKITINAIFWVIIKTEISRNFLKNNSFVIELKKLWNFYKFYKNKTLFSQNLKFWKLVFWNKFDEKFVEINTFITKLLIN